MFSGAQRAAVPDALSSWRDFILDRASTPGPHELHFLPLGIIANASPAVSRDLPPTINRYFSLAIDLGIAASVDEAFVMAKMGPTIALGFIGPAPASRWKGTRVHLDGGTTAPKTGVPNAFFRYLGDRASAAHQAQSARSAKQEANVLAALRRQDAAKLARSGTIRAVDADVRLFGLDRVFPEDPRPR